MKRSFQIPPFVGCSFVERTSSRHTGLGSPLAVQRENIFQSKYITVYKKSLLFLFFFHYITSLRIMFLSRDINFRHVRCITHAALCWGRKHTLTLKKKIAQCIWKVVTRFLWNDGKENRNLWGKKVKLER